MGRVEARLREMAIELPEPSRPGANYVPYARSGNLLFLTGQLSQWNGEHRYIGKLGREFGVPEGQHAARMCALNGASDLFVDLLGDAGRHTRMAVGVSALPYDVAVEVEGIFEVAPPSP